MASCTKDIYSGLMTIFQDIMRLLGVGKAGSTLNSIILNINLKETVHPQNKK